METAKRSRVVTGGLGLLALLAALKLALHLGTNLFAGYGYFRDELYYLACADHPGWGYVDQPPLSIWLLSASRALLGDSLFALRLLPALAGAATVFMTGLLAREMGGGRFAQGLAAGAAIVSLIHLAFGTVYSMNAFDLLLAATAFFWLARLIRTGEGWYWILLGLTVGLGLLNKVGMLWVALGVLAAVLLSRERRWLATRWPWLAGGLAALAFLPYVIWNVAHDWAHLEFIRNAVAEKYGGVTAADFLLGQILVPNPVTLPLWLGGLGYLLFAPRARSYRPLALVYLTAALVLLINGHSKPEYLSSTYVALFAGGGIAFESWLAEGGRRRLRPVPVALLMLGLVLFPVTLPVLPVETYIAYAETLGLQPSTSEGHELAELPQFYADMFGWEEKAAATAEVFRRLPAADRERAAILGLNYGRAGAIDLFGRGYGLPPAISTHNSYWLWGPGEATGELLIILGGEQQEWERRFESVEEVGRASCRYCIPYERDLPIFLCRGLKAPLDQAWLEAKVFI